MGAFKLDEYCVTGGGGEVEYMVAKEEARLGPDGMVMEMRKDGVGMAIYICVETKIILLLGCFDYGIYR